MASPNEPRLPRRTPTGKTAGPVHVWVHGKTDLGRTRDHNEDTFLVADLSSGAEQSATPDEHHVVGPRGSLFMVADGMGGAAAGELASAMAAETIYQHLATAWVADPNPSPERFATHIRAAVELANERIHHYAVDHPDVRGMGTTVTAAGVYGADLYLAQIGDSRGYLVRRGHAIQLTKDQSLMQRLVDAGELTEEEAEQSEHRNIILQALGPDSRIQVELTWQPIRRGDILVLCSDGLTSQVRKSEIAALASEEPDLPRLCSRLIDLANGRGGPDNITVVVAKFDGEGLPEPEVDDAPSYQAIEPSDLALDTSQAPGSAFAPAPGDASHFPAVRFTLSSLAYIGVAALLGLLGWWLLTR
ncbi:MAG: PP2C family protein-serine/threonine phosphatase [Gemmatimonadota bacterium]